MILVKNNLAIKAIGIVQDDQSNWYCKHTQVILVEDSMPIKAMTVFKRESLKRICITLLDFAYQHCCWWPTPKKIRETQGYVAWYLLTLSSFEYYKDIKRLNSNHNIHNIHARWYQFLKCGVSVQPSGHRCSRRVHASNTLYVWSYSSSPCYWN